eukprot:10355753-Ditylum_brightwellii.AAC.1
MHQQNAIAPLSSPPWHYCTSVSCCYYCPGPKTKKMNHGHRGSAVHAELQQTTLIPMPLIHWKCNFSGEGGGGDMRDATVQK